MTASGTDFSPRAAARWKTTAAPSQSVAQSTRERRLPVTTVSRHPAGRRAAMASTAATWLDGRTSARILRYPCATSRSSSRVPMKPLAPVTTTRSSWLTIAPGLVGDIGLLDRSDVRQCEQAPQVVAQLDHICHERRLAEYKGHREDDGVRRDRDERGHDLASAEGRMARGDRTSQQRPPHHEREAPAHR